MQAATHHPAAPPAADHPTTRRLYGWALALSAFTIAYNLAEGLLATWMGYGEEALTLFGFGVDSFIELASGTGILVMVLRMRRSRDAAQRTRFEVAALRVTGTAFYLLVAGLLAGAALQLWSGRAPDASWWGIGIALVSISVMWALIWGKERVGRALHSAPILADAACARVCLYMSLVLLASSGVYVLTGFRYADAVGALALAWLSYREGREAFEKAEGRACADGCSH